MLRRALSVATVAAVALVVVGGASAGTDDRSSVDGSRAFGGWDTTHTYTVKGETRTCTLTRGAKCAGAKLRGRVKHHGDLRKANLRLADLRFADLRGANLAGADLRGANL